MVRFKWALAAIAALSLAQSAAANDDSFPRLGGVNNGGTHNYDDTTYQAKLAKLNVVMLGIWPGWDGTRAMTMEQVVRNIKTINPGTRVFLYENSMEVDSSSASYAPVYDKVEKMKWWLSPIGTGTKMLSEYGTQTNKPTYQINTTLYGAKDSSGYQEWEWHARWIIDQLYKPNPSIDGFFEDNVFYQPRVSGDWNLDGVTDSPSAAGKWLREGYRARFALMHKLMPGKYVIGNLADWGTLKADLTELQGTLDGGIIEGILGPTYAPEYWGGWAEMMRWYRKTMDATGGPKWVLFNMQGSATDYQGVRYGLSSCLMDDGYFAFTDNALGYSGVPWFDEYNAKLGKAISSPAKAAWQKGVYRRDFENGIALVNPKGNGAQTVTLEESFKRLSGTQASSVNSGQSVTTLTLKDRDGIILLRTKPKSLPVAPRLISVN
jgi:hypothetical protein